MIMQARTVKVGLDGHLDEPGVREERRSMLRRIHLDLVEVVLCNFLQAMGKEKSADSLPGNGLSQQSCSTVSGAFKRGALARDCT
jgi:hypothetical protein